MNSTVNNSSGACQPSAVSSETHANTHQCLRVMMLVNNPCVSDARVIRQAEALANYGHEVLVLAHESAGVVNEERINGVTYLRVAVRGRAGWLPFLRGGTSPNDVETNLLPLSSDVLARAAQRDSARVSGTKLSARGVGASPKRDTLRRVMWLLKHLVAALVTSGAIKVLRHALNYPPIAKTWRPNVVHAHDLCTLLAGFRIARQAGSSLVYDSHELEVGRSGNFSRWDGFLRASIERWLITKAAAVVTVSDSIADFLANRYPIPRPTVIHNAPQIVRKKSHGEDVRAHLGLDENTRLAVYVGRITTSRGLEESVAALPFAADFNLVCVGPQAPATVCGLMNRARELGVADRLHILPPVDHDKVTAFIESADLSLVLIQDTCLSYHFSFPNKLLESLFAGVPVVASNLPEIAAVIERTKAGLVIDQTDPQAIADSMQTIASNRQSFVPTARVLTELVEIFGLEVQNRRLIDLYERLNGENVVL